jgi:hypothetical protein
MPSWIGVGVAIPLPVVVGLGAAEVGVWPIMLTHAYAFAQRPAQSEPALGFQARNWVVEIPLALAMFTQLSPLLT